MVDHTETRKYIHDLANHFAIIDASVTRALTLIQRNHPESTDEIQRLTKANEYMKKSIETLKELRSHIHSQIK
ncbi:MAG TPA: hypothetical protein VKZ84_02510 [Bacteriovoracaceae bacterium]|nr:hypothetical protein [Bacteriovoracaceae bacterium]